MKSYLNLSSFFFWLQPATLWKMNRLRECFGCCNRNVTARVDVCSRDTSRVLWWSSSHPKKTLCFHLFFFQFPRNFQFITIIHCKATIYSSSFSQQTKLWNSLRTEEMTKTPVPTHNSTGYGWAFLTSGKWPVHDFPTPFFKKRKNKIKYRLNGKRARERSFLFGREWKGHAQILKRGIHHTCGRGKNSREEKEGRAGSATPSAR